MLQCSAPFVPNIRKAVVCVAVLKASSLKMFSGSPTLRHSIRTTCEGKDTKDY